MHWTTLPRTDQIFTHIDSETKEERVFAVDRIRDCVAMFGDVYKRQTPVLRSVADMFIKRRGVEPHRLRRAIRTKKYDLLLYLEMEDGTMLLADGTHSYVALAFKEQKWADAYVVPKTMWKDFLVEGLPKYENEDDLINSYSGIKA